MDSGTRRRILDVFTAEHIFDLLCEYAADSHSIDAMTYKREAKGKQSVDNQARSHCLSGTNMRNTLQLLENSRLGKGEDAGGESTT